MRTPQIDTSGTEAAQRAIAAAQESAANLQKNFQADLKTENITAVTPGGAADAQAELGPTAKRKRTTGGLASQLGVNV